MLDLIHMTSPLFPLGFCYRIYSDSGFHAMSDLPSIEMKKLTVKYNERQDRLLLASQCDNDQVLGLWLTQRLATPLVKVLLSKLEQRVLAVSNAPASKPSVHRDHALQTWEQSAAHAKQLSSAAEPVSLPAQAQSGLIEKVNVSIHSTGVQLEFVVEGAPSAKLTMSPMAVRQWLAIMRAQFQRADWNIPGLWPAWFDAALRAGRASTDKVH